MSGGATGPPNGELVVYQGWRPLIPISRKSIISGVTVYSIVAVFLPVSFMNSAPGQFFRQFGISVAIAVVFSLLLARLLTPVMGAYLLRPHEGDGQRLGADRRAGRRR